MLTLGEEFTPAQAKKLWALRERRSEWIVRRTERIILNAEHSFERSTIFEIDLSKYPAEDIPTINGLWALPISELLRLPARHIRVSVQNEDVPVALRSQERELVSSGLAQTVEFDAAQLPTVHCLLSLDIERPFNKLTNDDENALSQLQAQRPRLSLTLRNLRQQRVVIALVRGRRVGRHFTITETHTERVAVKNGIFEGRVLRRRRAHETGDSLYDQWRAHPDGTERQDRLLTLSDGSAMTLTPLVGEEADTAYKERWGWSEWAPDTYVLKLGVHGYLECRSYHLEIESPAGTYIDKATLRLYNGKPVVYVDEGGRWHSDSVQTEVILVRQDDYPPNRAHFHFTREMSQRQAPDGEYVSGHVSVVLRPTYHDGLRGGFWVSLLATLILVVLLGSLGWHAAGYGPLPLLGHVRLKKPDTQSLVAAILVAPAAVIALVMRENEQPLSKVVQGQLRLRLSISAAALFIAAVGLSVGLVDHALFVLLTVCAIVSGYFCGVTGLVALTVRKRIREKAGVAPRPKSAVRLVEPATGQPEGSTPAT
ncbi:MAG: hypothetical protein QOK43_1980 [Acidimicrobiaceae bacterium]|nr:hypothetical protein [Acidimicrobiaceae bacterium]